MSIVIDGEVISWGQVVRGGKVEEVRAKAYEQALKFAVDCDMQSSLTRHVASGPSAVQS